MNKFFSIVILLFVFQMSSGQELLMETELVSSPDAFAPKFNGGGVDKFYEFINNEFDFSKVKKAGKMVFSFNVNELGEIKKIKVLEFPDIDAASEIIRVLNKSPKWESATRAGKPFSTEIKMPITFRYKFKEQVAPVLESKIESEKVNQELKKEDDKSEQDGLYNLTAVESKPNFPGGLQQFYNFIGKNYNSPYTQSGGKVIVSFVIEKDGEITDINVLRDIGNGSGAEAIRVLKKCPKWKPAMQNGKLVRCKYMLPIAIQPSK